MTTRPNDKGITLTVAELETAFKTYFDEMDRCETLKCYWALLHMIVALPDICAALESKTGDAGNGGLYRAWCKQNFRKGALSGEDRYLIRCALLHQGRTIPAAGRGSYASYSFIQPGPSGATAHNWVSDGRNITLDVGEMARDTRTAMKTWFDKLPNLPNAEKRANVVRNLRHLAKEKPKELPGYPGGIMPISVTVSSTTSSQG